MLIIHIKFFRVINFCDQQKFFIIELFPHYGKLSHLEMTNFRGLKVSETAS